MPVGRPSADRFREVNRLIDDLYSPARPEVVNTQEAAALTEPTYKAWRGRVYRVDPIPFEAGLDLHAGVERYSQATTASEQRAALRGLVRLYPKMAVPVGWRRWVRALLPNPFRRASEKEIIALADFFWTCRTGVSLRSSVRGAARSPRSSTGSTGSTSSSERTAAARAPGATTPTG